MDGDWFCSSHSAELCQLYIEGGRESKRKNDGQN